jgi:hypothetical protein
MAEGALVSAQVKHLVKPSGVTNAKQLAEAPNGAYLPGNPDDVFTIQTQKGGDLNVAMSALQRIEARLAQAFMLADMRDAERVTAEEVRLQALQLENSLGSIYAVLTVEFQSKYIARKLELFTRQGGMTQLPEGLVKPMVSVGLAAVGRGNDLEKTARFMQILQQTIGPEGLAQYVIPTELIRRHQPTGSGEDRAAACCRSAAGPAAGDGPASHGSWDGRPSEVGQRCRHHSRDGDGATAAH